MPGPVRKKQADPFVRAIVNGEPYGCFGQHLLNDPNCDGDRPCRWRGACQLYQEFCQHRGVSPTDELSMLPSDVVVPMVAHLVRTHVPGVKVPEARILRGWDRFHDAFVSELRRPIVHPSAEFAQPGELYVKTWKGTPGLYRARIICARRNRPDTTRMDPTLCRYMPNVRTRVSPTIQFAVDLRTLLERYPHARHLAYRWVAKWHVTGRAIGATAINVYTERVDDCGRLLYWLLSEGLLHSVRLDSKRGRALVRNHGRSKGWI